MPSPLSHQSYVTWKPVPRMVQQQLGARYDRLLPGGSWQFDLIGGVSQKESGESPYQLFQNPEGIAVIIYMQN